MNRFFTAGVIFAFSAGIAVAQPAPAQPPVPMGPPAQMPPGSSSQLTLDQQLDPVIADLTAKIYQLRDIIRQGSDQNAQLKNGWLAANAQVNALTKERDELKAKITPAAEPVPAPHAPTPQESTPPVPPPINPQPK